LGFQRIDNLREAKRPIDKLFQCGGREEIYGKKRKSAGKIPIAELGGEKKSLRPKGRRMRKALLGNSKSPENISVKSKGQPARHSPQGERREGERQVEKRGRLRS